MHFPLAQQAELFFGVDMLTTEKLATSWAVSVMVKLMNHRVRVQLIAFIYVQANVLL